MVVNKFLSLCVFLIITVTFEISFSQLVDEAAETTDIPTDDPLRRIDAAPTDIDTTSALICTTCECAEGVVNCHHKGINAPFELTDWYGLTPIQPKTVDLSHNPLASVSRIAKLPIQVLNMSYCDIESMDQASFTYLESMTILDLSRNKLSTSDLNKMVFAKFNSMNAGCMHEKVSRSLRSLSRVMFLFKNKGPIAATTGPQSFTQMSELYLSYNDIHSLPQDLFAFMKTLTILDLSGNPLAYIDQVTMGAISDLVNLRTLRLSSCELESVPEGLLRRHRKLRRLDLSDNRFTTVPVVLQEAPMLNFLSLDKNPIEAINDNKIFSKLTSLKELNLSRMSKLQNITGRALGGLINLEILRLNYNPRLTYLSPEFLVWDGEDGEQDWPLVKELYLNNNNLTTIDSEILESWNDLVAGDFTTNPYVCDCNNQWMVDVLTPLLEKTPQNNTVNNMICKKPTDVKGLTFAHLRNISKTLVCAEVANISEKPANLAVILGIMIGIVVTFPLVLILVLLWKKGYLAKCRRTDKKEPYPGYYDDENERL